MLLPPSPESALHPHSPSQQNEPMSSEEDRMLCFLLDSLGVAVRAAHDGAANRTVLFFLLELVPADAAHRARADARGSAAALFQELLQSAFLDGPRVAAKLARRLALTLDELPDPAGAAVAVRNSLESPYNAVAGISLLMLFQLPVSNLDVPRVLRQLLVDGQDALALDWAATLGHEQRVTFVRLCLELDKFKTAPRAVRQLGLSQEFPDVQHMCNTNNMERLTNKRLWPVALRLAGTDRRLQVSEPTAALYHTQHAPHRATTRGCVSQALRCVHSYLCSFVFLCCVR